jgi:hypothetical protein
MHLDIGVVGVGFARQHGFDLARLDLTGQRTDRRVGFLDDALVALLLAEFDQVDIVFQRLAEASERLDAVIEPLALAHHLLGFLRVVPEGRVLGAHVKVVQSFQGLIPVKDASSAGLWPA